MIRFILCAVIGATLLALLVAEPDQALGVLILGIGLPVVIGLWVLVTFPIPLTLLYLGRRRRP